MDFGTVIDILKRRKWLIAYVVVIGFVLAAAIFATSPKQYTATAQVLAIGVHAGGSPITTGIDLQTLATSSVVLEGVKRNLHEDVPLPVIQGRIVAHVNFGSNVMPIAYSDRSPREAVRGANAAAIELEKYYKQIASQRFDVVSSYLQKQMDLKRAQIEKVDAKLQQATIQDPYNADSDAAQALAQQIVGLQSQRDSLQAEMIGDRAQGAALARHLAEIAPVIEQEKAASDPYYEKLKAQASSDEAELATMRSDYRNGYPGLPGLQATVAQEKAQLAAAQQSALTSKTTVSPSYVAALSAQGSVDAKLASDTARVNAIDSQIAQTEDHLQAVPGMGVKLGDLRRQRDLMVTEYQTLAGKYVDVLATTAQEADVGSVAIIDRASMAFQSIDKRTMVGIVGTFGGFVIVAFALAFLLELMDPRIRTVAAVENLYGRPVLGTITTD